MMRFLPRWLAVISLCLVFRAEAVDLTTYTWHNRLLFLAAPSAQDPLVQKQRLRLRDRSDALADRDLKVFELYEQGPGLLQDEFLGAQAVTRLRRELGLRSGDRELILIGKDGGIKLRAPLSSDLREVFALIDTMPMRRLEMRRKRAAGESVTPP